MAEPPIPQHSSPASIAEPEVLEGGSTPRIAAFFDLDGTLLSVNSARLWVEHERRAGRVSTLQQLEALLWFSGYVLGISRMELALERAVRTLEGQNEAELEARTRAWYHASVAPLLLPSARAAVESHRQRGHRLVLLTSSSPYVSRAVVETLGLHDYLCTRFEVRAGHFTGRPILPFCYGPGKVILAREWADAHQIPLDASYFYTDSLTDLPMLEAVGHPVVVRPDLRLKRLARRRDWPIARW